MRPSSSFQVRFMSEFTVDNVETGFQDKDYTLVFCIRNKLVKSDSQKESKEILLGMKKRGFGAGKWNGFGGKIEPNETVEEAAARELNEESGLKAEELLRRGYLVFNMKESKKIMRVHVFECYAFTGEPIETEEMRPQWYDVNAIPYDSMWIDDKLWLPSLIKENKLIMGRFEFDDDETIIDYSVSLK